jgi:hypothetical protein
VEHKIPTPHDYVAHLFERPVLQYPLYRYDEYQYFETFLETGRLMLSPLWRYRDETLLGSLIGDEEEGFHASEPLDGGFPMLIGGYSVNAWILCVCDRPVPRMYADCGKDCCYVIEDINFFIEIGKALAVHKFRYGSVAHVDYWDPGSISRTFRETIARGRPWPMLANLKRRRYAWQKEVRGIWEPWTAEAAAERAELQAEEDARPGDSFDEMVPRLRAGMKLASAFPDLKPIFIDVPAAIPFVKLYERR